MSINVRAAELKKIANQLPLTPGVYLMKDAHGEVIYVGKAKALKNRVTQYFGSETNHNQKVRKMVENVDHFETILCDTEFEAFILENSLIKQYQPKYNILLKDDKGYHYIKITDDKWRRLEWVKQKDDTGTYIGPYNSGYVVSNTVDEARKIFKLPVCSRSFDRVSKPCLNYHLGLCSAPCRGKMSTDEYNAQVEAAVAFIKKGGYSEQDLQGLKKKMELAAENLDFEYAARLRDRIEAVRRIGQKQKVFSQSHESQDVFAMVFAEKTACLQYLKFRNGRLCDQNHYFLEGVTADSDVYSEFLPQFYDRSTDLPDRVVLDRDTEFSETLSGWLSQRRGKKTQLIVPKIGDQRRLIDLCRTNAAENLSRRLDRGSHETDALSELAELLHLTTPPRYIESYDISHTAGQQNVAAMVVFSDGKPDRRHYRKFKIKSFTGQDDCLSMAEVLDRRFAEYIKGSDEAFSRLPDLILLDGGKGQVSAVIPILQKHGLTVPLFGMVKDNKHRTRAIATGDSEIALKPTRRAFTLVTAIQDEVHRSAITYHKKRRSQKMLESELIGLEGIGPKRTAVLYKHFKTVENLAMADEDELASLDGMTSSAAKTVYRRFHSDKTT